MAGTRAQVVVANPAGVTCDGCGFINASRATVTTGTPISSGGNLEGYRVQGGTVTVTGEGMDASTTDYADVIARAVVVNAGIWAGQLKVIGGANQVNIDAASGEHGVAQAISPAGSAPAFSIDVARLGGMYARKIVLVGSEAGVGVRNAGTLYAGVGDVIVTADGRLENVGQIASAGHVQATARAGVRNTGSVHAQGNIGIAAGGDLVSSGAVSARGDVTLAAAAGMDLSGAAVSAGQTFTASAGQTLRTDRAAISANRIAIAAHDFLNGQGEILQTGAGDLSITLQGGLDNAGGKLLSEGGLAVTLGGNFANTGQVAANGGITLQAVGAVTNSATIAAGGHLALQGFAIDNQAAGTVTGASVALQAPEGTITNRGLVDGGQTLLAAQAVNNLGTGRIYGGHVAISAGTLNNLAEGGSAPVIAARERLDIGAAFINNREHALVFSGGDLAIGGTLDADGRAAGKATVLHNASATIEALGSLAISAVTLNNTNEHFSTTTEELPQEHITEYQGAGSPNRYAPGTPDVFIYNDESDHLHTPEGNYEQWSAYAYTRTVTETRIAGSDPGRILSGGGMQLTVDTLNNDKSRVVAGGSLTGAIGTLSNTEVAGERVITDAGTVTSYWREHPKGRDYTGSSMAGYNPPPMVEAITLTPAVFQQNTVPGGTGMEIAALPGSPGIVVRTGGIDLGIPHGSLFSLVPGAGTRYLVETDPRFTNYRTWLSSDYLLQALAIDPALTQKRLGDGFYEQRLIREQVAQLTGRRFLDGYADDEAQFAALMESGGTYAKAWNLTPGVALSAAQMAQLTSDFVWLVEKDIALPDGSIVKALVPQLYVRVQEGDLQSGGALIAGNSVNLNVKGDLANGGTIAGRTAVALTAENIHNLGGRIAAQDVSLAARRDLNNIGGTVSAGNSLTAAAGRDLHVVSTTRTQANAQGSVTNIERVAGLYVTGAGGTLVASAGRDANIVAGVVATTGQDSAAAVIAGGNLNLGTVTESRSNQLTWSAGNHRSDATSTETGSHVQAQGNLTLQAGKDINARAATVQAGGALNAAAGRDINLDVGRRTDIVDEAHVHTSKKTFSRSTVATRDSVDREASIGTSFSGGTVAMQAGRDINIKGSSVVSDSGTVLAAKNDVNIEAAVDTTREEHLRAEKKSGLFSGGGIGVTLGSRKQSTDTDTQATTAAASTVGAVQGDVVIRADNRYTQAGSDVLAPGGDVDILAKDVKITEAREAGTVRTEQKFSQSGLTVSLSSPVIDALQTVGQMAGAAGKTGDTRMQALAAAGGAMAAKQGAQALEAGQGVDYGGKSSQILGKDAQGNVTSRDATAADKAGGINLSISLGSASSQSVRTSASDSARGSSVAAGGDVSIRATGGGESSNVVVQGSTVRAGGTVDLDADNKVLLLAARNTASQTTTDRSKSGAIGLSIGTNTGVTVSASAARGNADGHDVTYTNTQVQGSRVNVKSGGDTDMKGAVVTAHTVTAQVGGNLNIESLQDTSVYKETRKSAGGSLTIGAGVSGSISAGRSNIDSHYASVTEQSGIRAGDGGFQVEVQGKASLNGGAITSTQKAVEKGRNVFDSKEGVTLSDIRNTASYSGRSVGINIGAGMSLDGKATPQGTSAGTGKDGGSANSTTHAAISGIAGNKEARTGDAQAGIKPIFDPQNVRNEIEAQAAITAEFGRQASKAVGDYAAAQMDKAHALDEQARAEADPAKRAALEAQAGQLKAEWGDNGTLRLAAHAAIGGLTGGTSGAAGAAAGTLSAPVIAEALVKAGVDGPLATALTGLGSTVVGAAVGGSSGGAAALNEVANNYLKHSANWRSSQWGSFKEELARCKATPSCRVDAVYTRYSELSSDQQKAAIASMDAMFGAEPGAAAQAGSHFGAAVAAMNMNPADVCDAGDSRCYGFVQQQNAQAASVHRYGVTVAYANDLVDGGGGKPRNVSPTSASPEPKRSPVRTGDYLGSKVGPDETTFRMTEYELPRKAGGTLAGQPEMPPVNAPAEQRRSIERQNEAGRTLSEHGFNVERLPNDGGRSRSKQPDLKINGEIADVYSPRSGNVKSVWDQLVAKADPANPQASTIILNLADSPLGASEIAQYAQRNSVPGLRTVVVIKNGRVSLLTLGN